MTSWVATIFTLEYAVTTAVNDQALSPMIRNYLVTSDVVDSVRSRAVVYPTPTVTLGPEEAQ